MSQIFPGNLTATASASLIVGNGNEGWMIVATAMVGLMTPALALFYASLVAIGSVVSTMMLSFGTMAVVSVIFSLVGFPIAFGGNADPWGWSVGESIVGMNNEVWQRPGVPPPADGTLISTVVFLAYQTQFSAITAAIVTGVAVQRMNFFWFLIFIALWHLVVYAPITHAVGNPSGFLAQWGVLDFAGGLFVHTSSGVSSLVLSLLLRKRRDAEKSTPHNLPLVLLSASLLFFGWFAFTGGSALAANYSAGRCVIITHLGACIGLASWNVLESIFHPSGWGQGRPTAVGAACGLVTGLVAITPCAGFVAPVMSLPIAAIVTSLVFFAQRLIKSLKIDDRLDCFPIHGVGGMAGTLCVGLFASSDVGDLLAPVVDGAFYGRGVQLGKQLVGVIFTVACSALGTLVVFCFCRLVAVMLRTDMELPDDLEEKGGPDNILHGERAYYWAVAEPQAAFSFDFEEDSASVISFDPSDFKDRTNGSAAPGSAAALVGAEGYRRGSSTDGVGTAEECASPPTATAAFGSVGANEARRGGSFTAGSIVNASAAAAAAVAAAAAAAARQLQQQHLQQKQQPQTEQPKQEAPARSSESVAITVAGAPPAPTVAAATVVASPAPPATTPQKKSPNKPSSSPSSSPRRTPAPASLPAPAPVPAPARSPSPPSRSSSSALVPAAGAGAPSSPPNSQSASTALLRKNIAHRRLLQKEVAMMEQKKAAARAMTSYTLHDLRVPLQALSLGIQELRYEISECDSCGHREELAEVLTGMDLASTQMEKVMDTALTWEKMEAGKFKLELSPMSVHQFLSVAAMQIRKRAAQENVNLVLDIDHRAPAVMLGDFHRLLQIVLNYCSNAVKFSPKDGTGRVKLRLGVQGIKATGMTAAIAEAKATPVQPSGNSVEGGGDFWPEDNGEAASTEVVHHQQHLDVSPSSASSRTVASAGSSSSSSSWLSSVFRSAFKRPSLPSPPSAALHPPGIVIPPANGNGASSSSAVGTSTSSSFGDAGSRGGGRRLPNSSAASNASSDDDHHNKQGKLGKAAIQRVLSEESHASVASTVDSGGSASAHGASGSAGSGAASMSLRVDEGCVRSGTVLTWSFAGPQTVDGSSAVAAGKTLSTDVASSSASSPARRIFGRAPTVTGPTGHPPAFLPFPPSHNTTYSVSLDVSEQAVTNLVAMVCIEVQDNGIGIPAEQQQQLFKPWSQISAGKLQDGKGSGLGLSLCKEIVTRMGGDVYVYSSGQPGYGSTFGVALPMRVLKKINGPSHAATATTISDPATSAGGMQKGGTKIAATTGASAFQSWLQQQHQHQHQHQTFSGYSSDASEGGRSGHSGNESGGETARTATVAARPAPPPAPATSSRLSPLPEITAGGSSSAGAFASGRSTPSTISSKGSAQAGVPKTMSNVDGHQQQRVRNSNRLSRARHSSSSSPNQITLPHASSSASTVAVILGSRLNTAEVGDEASSFGRRGLQQPGAPFTPPKARRGGDAMSGSGAGKTGSSDGSLTQDSRDPDEAEQEGESGEGDGEGEAFLHDGSDRSDQSSEQSSAVVTGRKGARGAGAGGAKGALAFGQTVPRRLHHLTLATASSSSSGASQASSSGGVALTSGEEDSGLEDGFSVATQDDAIVAAAAAAIADAADHHLPADDGNDQGTPDFTALAVSSTRKLRNAAAPVVGPSASPSFSSSSSSSTAAAAGAGAASPPLSAVSAAVPASAPASASALLAMMMKKGSLAGNSTTSSSDGASGSSSTAATGASSASAAAKGSASLDLAFAGTSRASSTTTISSSNSGSFSASGSNASGASVQREEQANERAAAAAAAAIAKNARDSSFVGSSTVLAATSTMPPTLPKPVSSSLPLSATALLSSASFSSVAFAPGSVADSGAVTVGGAAAGQMSKKAERTSPGARAASLAVAAAEPGSSPEPEGSPPSSLNSSAATTAAPAAVFTAASPAIPCALCVDDSSVNLKFLARALKRAFPGTELLTAENGQQAVEVVRARMASGGVLPLPAFITCDREMPVMDGREAVKSLRSIGYRGLVIGVTGAALLEEKQEFLQAGADHVLAKPINFQSLVDMVHSHHLGVSGGGAQ